MNRAELFVEHRPTMLAAAYRVTGSRHDAEDVVQEAWLSWSKIDPTTVREPRSFLAVMVSRLALNAVRSRQRRREEYIGPWLPEPVVDDGDPQWAVLHEEGLGQALDFVLSTLTPEQATAFVLRKLLDVDYADIAEALGSSPGAARQHVSRALRAVTDALGDALPDQADRDGRALAALAQAVTTGDVARVAELLAHDAVLYSDGGGKAHAALRPVVGPDKIARFLLGIAAGPRVTMAPARINGSAGVVFLEAGIVSTAATLRASEIGIVGLYFVRNPDKLESITLATGTPNDEVRQYGTSTTLEEL
ncbi:MAG: RNA polymerase sigma factor SigJ [Actinomycetales bacterium]|nr:RNA polymerase sigma factor SigJ [Actinomycetales bacterium]